MKKILYLIVILIWVFGCSNTKDKTLEEIIAEENYMIVDVRTKEEYEANHVVGAINIPYDKINDNVILLDKNKTILVYCATGRRSNIAFETLKKLDYEVYDLGAYNSINLDKE